MIKLPTAHIERATSEYDDRFAYVYFDKDESRLIATDGFIMAVIPVESQCEDRSGTIPRWALRIAREMDGSLGLCGEKIVITSDRRGTTSCPRPAPASNWTQRLVLKVRRLLAGTPRKDKDAVVIALDARRLLQLTEALSDNPEWHCGLKLYIHGPEEPILVEPHRTTLSEYDGRFGLIMPIIGGNVYELGETYMTKRYFRLAFNIEGVFVDTAVIELDDRVIEAVDDAWRAQFYNLHTPEDIAQHIGYNLIVNRQRLSDLDGWADQPDCRARVIEWPDLEQDIVIVAVEVGYGKTQ